MFQVADEEDVLRAHRIPGEASLVGEIQNSLDLAEVVRYLDLMNPEESAHLWSELDRLIREPDEGRVGGQGNRARFTLLRWPHRSAARAWTRATRRVQDRRDARRA